MLKTKINGDNLKTLAFKNSVRYTKCLILIALSKLKKYIRYEKMFYLKEEFYVLRRMYFRHIFSVFFKIKII